MTDPYDYWKRRQRGESPPPVVDEPMCGFYRVRSHKNGPLLPLAIYPDPNGGIIGVLADAIVNGDKLNTLWQFACQSDISEDAYRATAERGEGWSDEHQASPREVIGGNNPPTDPAELLAEQIDAAERGVADYAAITSDDQSIRAQTLRSRLLELSGEADDARVVEKQPSLNESKRVDGKWQPLVKRAKEAADKIRAAMRVWENVKLTKQQEEARAVQKAIDDQAKLEAAGVRVAAFAPPPPIAQVAVPRTIKGASGRAAAVNYIDAVDTVDFDTLYAAVKGEKGIQDMMFQYAVNALKRGSILPGVVTKRVADVR